MTAGSARPGLSIIVPAHNEAATLRAVLESLARLALPVAAQVIVVDDGSTDGTAALLAGPAGRGVTALRHAERRGKGAAVRTGLEAADGDFTLIQDADLEYDPGDIAALLAPALRG